MSVKIIKTSPTTYIVNEKEVYEDSDGRICSRMELTLSEEKALQQYLAAQRNDNFNAEGK